MLTLLYIYINIKYILKTVSLNKMHVLNEVLLCLLHWVQIKIQKHLLADDISVFNQFKS